MTNIFNDLNKLVNTVQKVDKLLTVKEKPQTKRKSYKEECEILKDENARLRYQVQKLQDIIDKNIGKN
jgi:cell division protein FtsB